LADTKERATRQELATGVAARGVGGGETSNEDVTIAWVAGR
jgi:hypothetical protein